MIANEKTPFGRMTFAGLIDGTALCDVSVSGRLRWAFEAPIDAGEKECTAADTPASRWSHYLHQLRGSNAPTKTLALNHEGPLLACSGLCTLFARSQTEAAA